jgi:hypothetical protein
MKNNSIKILLAALCCSTMNAELLSMDFVEQTKVIIHRENTISRQEGIHQRLDHIHNTLVPKHKRLVEVAVCSGPKMLENMKKATEVSHDIKAVKASQCRLDHLLMRGYSIEDATDEVQLYIDGSPLVFNATRPTTQTLLQIFSLPSSSAYNR